MHLDSELLRTFLAIVDTGSLTKAGEKIGRTQSAVSLQLKRLEAICGTSLFRRDRHGVKPTSQAEFLLPKARRIAVLLDEVETLLPVRPLEGRVRIGIPEEYGRSILPTALASFAKRHPSVEVIVRHGRSSVLQSAVEANELDLAVVFEQEGRMPAELLAVDPTVWVTSSLHQMHETDPVPVALYESQGWCNPAALRSLNACAIRFRVAYTSDTSGALRAAVVSGLAIAPLSRSLIPRGCRELGPLDGFHTIDLSSVGLVRRRDAGAQAVAGMAEAIKTAFAEDFEPKAGRNAI